MYSSTAALSVHNIAMCRPPGNRTALCLCCHSNIQHTPLPVPVTSVTVLLVEVLLVLLATSSPPTLRTFLPGNNNYNIALIICADDDEDGSIQWEAPPSEAHVHLFWSNGPWPTGSRWSASSPCCPLVARRYMHMELLLHSILPHSCPVPVILVSSTCVYCLPKPYMWQCTFSVVKLSRPCSLLHPAQCSFA